MLLAGIVLASSTMLFAQQEQEKEENPWREWSVSAALQSDMHVTTIPGYTGSRFMQGSYLTGQLRNKYLELDTRLEAIIPPLPGRENERGWGLPYLSLKGKYKGLELTVGDIYEQFGSGAMLRAYEDRNLGLDNAIRGGRIRYGYRDMITAKLLGGQQRNHFDRGWKIFNKDRGYLVGSDLELGLENIFTSLKDKQLSLHFGASYVHKHEAMDNIVQLREGEQYLLLQPKGVNAYGGRMMLNYQDLTLNVEMAMKDSDPNVTNNYIFRRGSYGMLTASYLWGRNSLFFGVRRSENFDFRSDRAAELNDLRINFLQPFVKQQTFTLAALYPYATRPVGEWSFQGEYSYRFKRGSLLGGKYGTSLKVYAGVVTDLKREWIDPSWDSDRHNTAMVGTMGYKSSFGMGKYLFHDIGIEISKRVTKNYSFLFSYMNQYYNQLMIEGVAINDEVIHSNIFIYEGKHKLSKKVSLRTELQYLHSPNAHKDWLYGMAEVSLAPYFVFSVSDLWNVGATKEHFYMGAVAGVFGRHRVQLSYGKTREGINCSGGVCRMMPATEGIYLTYNVAI